MARTVAGALPVVGLLTAGGLLSGRDSLMLPSSSTLAALAAAAPSESSSVSVAVVLAAAVISLIAVVVGFGGAMLLAPILLILYPAPQVAATLTTLGIATAGLAYAAGLKDPQRPRVYRKALV